MKAVSIIIVFTFLFISCQQLIGPTASNDSSNAKVICIRGRLNCDTVPVKIFNDGILIDVLFLRDETDTLYVNIGDVLIGKKKQACNLVSSRIEFNVNKETASWTL